jgi:hypothetical protein
VSLVPPSEPRHSAVVLLAAAVPLAAPSEPPRLVLAVRLLFVKEALSVGHPEPLHFAPGVARCTRCRACAGLSEAHARQAGCAGTSATCSVLGLEPAGDRCGTPAQVPLAPKAEEAGVATAGSDKAASRWAVSSALSDGGQALLAAVH